MAYNYAMSKMNTSAPFRECDGVNLQEKLRMIIIFPGAHFHVWVHHSSMYSMSCDDFYRTICVVRGIPQCPYDEHEYLRFGHFISWLHTTQNNHTNNARTNNVTNDSTYAIVEWSYCSVWSRCYPNISCFVFRRSNVTWQIHMSF